MQPMSSSSKLFFVRHARPIMDPNVPVAQWQLDPQGRAELERLANLPDLRAARRIVASTEPKAMGTAMAIQAAQGLPLVECFAELGEVHKASFVGDHDAAMAQLFAEPETSARPGWEPAATALRRFGACVDRLRAETEGDLIVVAHGTVISLYLTALLGEERADTAAWAAIGFPDLAILDPHGRQILQPFGAWRV